MKHFVDAYLRGVPIIGLRTATHAFNFPGGTYASYNGWGKRVLGENWVDHWGHHKSEADRAIPDPSQKDNPILNGVGDIFCTTDVYEAHPPADATILFRGEVVEGMKPSDPPANYKRKNSKGKQQGINDPMMATCWTRIYKNEAGKENHVFCTTMGAAVDFTNESLRRLVVNAVYWGLGMEIPRKADVEFVDPYHPTHYDFNGYKKGKSPGRSRRWARHSMKQDRLRLPRRRAPRPPVFRCSSIPAITSHSSAACCPIVFSTMPGLKRWCRRSFPKTTWSSATSRPPATKSATWHRSENFGTRDEWLKKEKTDVIFAFYGYNESFKGTEGLDQFKQDLTSFCATHSPPITAARDAARRALLADRG